MTECRRSPKGGPMKDENTSPALNEELAALRRRAERAEARVRMLERIVSLVPGHTWYVEGQPTPAGTRPIAFVGCQTGGTPSPGPGATATQLDDQEWFLAEMSTALEGAA